MRRIQHPDLCTSAMNRLAAVAVLLAPAAAAQVVPDRPGLGIGSEALTPGAVQVEAGLPEAALTSGLDTYALPVQLRVGLAPGIEARVAAGYSWALDALQNDAGSGFSPVVAGVKVEIPVPDVALALVTEVVVPVDGGGAVGVQLNAPATVTSGSVEVSLMPGVVVQDGTTTLNLVATLGRDLGGALSAYAELGAFPVVGGGSGTPVYVGGGLTVIAHPDVQLDVFADAGVSGGAADVLIGVGLAFRIR